MSDHHAGCCDSCDAALPAGDDAGLCSQCTENAQVAPDGAPLLAADFWEYPEIRSALLDRHFGRLLRAYRTSQSPQIKQAELARWLGITQGQLSRIERSSTPMNDLHKMETWARALHIPLDRLWFTPSPASDVTEHTTSHRVTVKESPPNEKSNVYRRDLFKSAGVTAAAVGTSILSETPWQRLID